MAQKKKDFSQINTGRVYNAIADATAEPEEQEVQATRKQRKTYSEQEAQQALYERSTSGRKGIKLSRINMGFASDVYAYIQTMSRVSGCSMTDFVNKCLRQHMEEHKDIYDRAIEFRNSL